MSSKNNFPNGNVIIIGPQLNLLSVALVKEIYGNNINLSAFIKKIYSSVRNMNSRRRVQAKAFLPKDTLFKGMLIKAKTEIYRIINSVKFENS
jgi:head-tail adaptor